MPKTTAEFPIRLNLDCAVVTKREQIDQIISKFPKYALKLIINAIVFDILK